MNVKPACHKIYQWWYYLLIFSSYLYTCIFSVAILTIKHFQCLLAQRSVCGAIGNFVRLKFAPNPCARLDGWKKKKKKKKNVKIASVTTDKVCFIWSLNKKNNYENSSWFWSFHEGMNGITDAHSFVLRAIDYDYESMRKNTLEFAKEKYFNGHSDNRSVQENFDLLTSFIQDSADKHIPSKTSRSVS